MAPFRSCAAFSFETHYNSAGVLFAAHFKKCTAVVMEIRSIMYEKHGLSYTREKPCFYDNNTLLRSGLMTARGLFLRMTDSTAAGAVRTSAHFPLPNLTQSSEYSNCQQQANNDRTQHNLTPRSTAQSGER